MKIDSANIPASLDIHNCIKLNRLCIGLII